ncbi:hypothetical protein ACLOJK_004889 [Asimina triloba]
MPFQQPGRREHLLGERRQVDAKAGGGCLAVGAQMVSALRREEDEGDEERKWYLSVRMRGGRRGRKMRKEDESTSSHPGEDGETSAGDEGGGARFVISNASALNALTAVGFVRDSVL